MLSRSLRARLSALLLALLLLATSSAALAVPFDGVAARINNEIVTMYDVREAARPYLLQRGIDPAVLQEKGEREKIYRTVLDDLIERTLLVQEAKKLNIGISDAELEQSVAYMRQQQDLTEDQFKASVEQYGMNYEDYLKIMRENLLRQRITQQRVGSKVNVTDADVEDAYRSRFGEIVKGETRFLTVSHILIQPDTQTEEDLAVAYERILAAQQRLQAGEEFAVVVQEESDVPTAANDGILGTFQRGQLDKEFEDAVFALSEGEVSEVVQTRFGYHIIKIIEEEMRVDPKAERLVQGRLDQVRGELMQRALERQYKTYISGLKTRAFVEVKI